MTTARHTPTAGVRKRPRHEVAGNGAPSVQRALRGGAPVGTELAKLNRRNHYVLARVLSKKGKVVFGVACDSNDVSKMATHALHLEVVEPKVIDAERGGKPLGQNNPDRRVNDAQG